MTYKGLEITIVIKPELKNFSFTDFSLENLKIIFCYKIIPRTITKISPTVLEEKGHTHTKINDTHKYVLESEYLIFMALHLHKV